MKDGGLSTGAVIAAVAGGSSLGALVTLLVTATRETLRARRIRRGRARLIHEDLYRLQSTLTRMYYGTSADAARSGWLLRELASRDDYLDVLSALREPRLDALSSALGWEQYLRVTWERGGTIEDELIRRIYERFAAGRWAIGRLAGGALRSWDYRPHDPSALVPADERKRNAETPLEALSLERAQQAAGRKTE